MSANFVADELHGDPDLPQIVVDVRPDFTPVALVLRRPLGQRRIANLRAHLRRKAGKELASEVVVIASGNALVVRAFSWCDAARYCLSVRAAGSGEDEGDEGGEEDSGIRYYLTVQNRKCSCGACYEEKQCRPDQWRDWQLTLDEMLSCSNCKTRTSRRNFLDPLSPLLLFTE